MPELPEVETVRRILEQEIVGLTFKEVNLIYPRLVVTSKSEFQDKLIDKTILSLDRKGKFLILHLTSNYSLLVHFRMEGKLYHLSKEEMIIKNPKHISCYFEMDDTSYLIFEDVRKFGVMGLYKTDELVSNSPIANLGKEPWDITNPSEYLTRAFKNKKYMLKEGLLDQSVIAGLGNIYADEVLFSSRLNPFMKVSELTNYDCEKIVVSSRNILDLAIQNKGSTIISYHPSQNTSGNMQNFLKVYGKKGQECPICHTKIEKRFVNNRGTSYCPKCQNVYPSLVLTGKIASGKSVVLSLFKQKGFNVASADEIVHSLYNSESFIKELKAKFPKVITENKLDKKKVVTFMLEDKQFRKNYQNYIWSKVKDKINEFLIENTSYYQVVEVPLLFEAKMESDFSYVIGVETTKQEEYLKIRNDEDPSSRLKMNSINLYDQNKDKMDFIIKNNGNIDDLNSQIDEIIEKLEAKYHRYHFNVK